MVGNDCFSGYVYVVPVCRYLISVELQTVSNGFELCVCADSI